MRTNKFSFTALTTTLLLGAGLALTGCDQPANEASTEAPADAADSGDGMMDDMKEAAGDAMDAAGDMADDAMDAMDDMADDAMDAADDMMEEAGDMIDGSAEPPADAADVLDEVEDAVDM